MKVYRLPFTVLLAICYLLLAAIVYAQDKKAEPIIVNGDIVEYSTKDKEVTATGNVSVSYQGTTLTCEKLTVNPDTKDGVAEGNARLEDEKGVIEGSRIIYNFQAKSGMIIDSEFRSNPFFGKAEKTDKISDEKFISRRGYISTCSYDEPHYRFKSRKIDFFPHEKVKATANTFYVGRMPLAYLPQYTQSLKDPLMHVQLVPGKSKNWGPYVLSAWKYSITDNIKGRIYSDYRDRLGVAEGFGANYDTKIFGKGDFKYYYTQERAKGFEEGIPAEFQRFLIRLRHQWNIDERTELISEYYKITDSKRIIHGTEHNVLKDYFPREYEKDSLPLSYVSLHRTFDYSSLDFLMQKRINRWYDQEEKLPEIKYTFPSLQLGESPFYFENLSSYVNYNDKNAVPSPSWDDTTENRFETMNKISLPAKASFFKLVPFVSSQQNFHDKDVYGWTLINIFTVGSEVTTKFYRLFNIKSDFLGLDINDLRHIITPTANYSYAHTSTMPTSKAKFGGGASTGNASVVLELSNKLQTKRKNNKVDLADFRISSNYAIRPKSGAKRGSSFSDFLFDLELIPYSWMRIDADTTYNHYQDYVSNANYDVTFDFGEERFIAFGQRYQRKGGNEITYSFNWRLSPKWKFLLYQRRNRGHVRSITRGLKEQEYSISRDLHCWTVDFTYNVKRGEGETVWLIFRLKAFPEVEFNYNQMYHAPKSGSQGYH
ncbi:MAG: LPS export ABC transporter periplasmic protein LptC [Candidatus Omnitrophica bacterium]|nr:LPS export ABC transporter periplasmic protein LptC [Candidatus Omnitrophota bacterium]MBU4472976.1 LPS export ABC transporter periplasmic protein LptC [Candidatus Omnitrophota bacterium]MCG2706994.1 hypothetical protein [Candidatus Omnitrophota bacterium]